MPRAQTLCVIRHGHAGDALENPARDDERTLTRKGRAQSRRAGRALERLGLAPAAIWTSPLPRAVETADEAAAAADADAPRVVTSALRSEAPPGRLLAELAKADAADRAAGKAPGPLVRWVVGHQPHLSSFVALCVEDLPGDLRIAKGDVLVLASTKGVVAGAFRLLHRFPAPEPDERS